MQIAIGQDSENVILPPDINCKFDLGDTKYIKTEDRTVFDFVGFVINRDNTVAVFPKHYFSDVSFSGNTIEHSERKEDITLLFEVLRKYITEQKRSAKAERYIGKLKEFESDFPFEPFFQVYDYYKKYGIYYDEIQRIEKGTRGKVSWKRTIQNAQVLVSNGNLIYLPLYSKTTDMKNVFVSECMVFVINYTLRLFPYFLSMKPVPWNAIKLDFIKNKTYVLQELHKCQPFMFKDIHKRLLESLIRFFEELNDKKHGGDIHVKINYFDRIWQTMVNKYLNDCFSTVDSDTGEIIFDESLSSSTVPFGPRHYVIDASGHAYSIELDHYGIESEKQYVFDSKYYYEVRDLDYKQFVYDVVMDHYENSKNRLNTYSALLLPGNGGARMHLDLLRDFGGLKMNDHKIVEQPLNVKKIMQHYVQA